MLAVRREVVEQRARILDHEVLKLVQPGRELERHRLRGIRDAALNRAELAGVELHHLFREGVLHVEVAGAAGRELERLQLLFGEVPRELREELDRLTLPFTDDQVPSDAELRIAQAQLVGWLEGLFHGIQTALFAQQMAARVQLEQMRGRVALPPGSPAPPTVPGPVGGTGQYL